MAFTPYVEQIVDGRVNVLCNGVKSGGDPTVNTTKVKELITVCFGSPDNPHGLNSHDNLELFFPPGDFNFNEDLLFSKVVGGKITGSGRFVTTLRNQSGSNLISTNGFSQCVVSGFEMVGDAILFNLNWDNSLGGNALQNNMFSDIYCSGGTVGFEVGADGFMGSENTWRNCAGFGGIGGKGSFIRLRNFNALTNVLGKGCNLQAYDIAADVQAGSLICSKMGFQLSKTCDVRVLNTGGSDILNMYGVRTESRVFVVAGNNVVVYMAGCSQVNTPDDGVIFLKGTFPGVRGEIIGSASKSGQITGYATCVGLTGCDFGNASVTGELDSPYRVDLTRVWQNGVLLANQSITG